MRISNPEIKVVLFNSEDVIATSLGPLSGTAGYFYIPSSQYSGGNFTDQYVGFVATFGNYNGTNYDLVNVSGAQNDDSGRLPFDNIQNGMFYFSDYDVYVPVDPTMKAVSQGVYNAYAYGNGNYYSDGINYTELYHLQ